MFVTIDPYYSTVFFNETKEALKNNNVEYQLFINIKAPYNWYFKLKSEPLMLNYDLATEQETKWMVNAVLPLRSNEEYLLLRRNNDNGAKALLKFIENKALKAARLSDYAVFFTVKNKEELTTLSKSYAGKLWYLGKYYGNKYRICLGTHAIIKTFLSDSQILLEKVKDISEPGRFESELNWKVFHGKDELIKFTETPYMQKGIYHDVKIRGDLSSRFLL